MVIASIAASEERCVAGMDVGGAFLNADLKSTGVMVHMRLDKLMTSLLVKIDPEFEQFVEKVTGTSVLRLGKALYGCVEAAAGFSFWFILSREKFTGEFMTTFCPFFNQSHHLSNNFTD
jgi:hypothetical protein